MECINIKEKAFNKNNAKKKKPPPNRKGKTNPTDRMTKEQLAWAIQKKKECNTKALNIVKELIEPVDDQQLFLSKLKDINQCHYQDIVEERAISKMCGYPLCEEPLEDMPKKQFHISRATNRIYDITERKNFCSNTCYRSSNYIKEQLFTSPLWLRAQEEIPEFKLLSLDNKKQFDIDRTKGSENDEEEEDEVTKMLRIKMEVRTHEFNLSQYNKHLLLGEINETNEMKIEKWKQSLLSDIKEKKQMPSTY